MCLCVPLPILLEATTLRERDDEGEGKEEKSVREGVFLSDSYYDFVVAFLFVCLFVIIFPVEGKQKM